MDLLRGKSAERSEVLATASAPAGSGGSGLVLTSSWQGYSGWRRACPSQPAPACRSQIAECHLVMDQNMIRGTGQEGQAAFLCSLVSFSKSSHQGHHTCSPIREKPEKEVRANPWGGGESSRQPMDLLSGAGVIPRTWAGILFQPVYF